MEEFEDLEVNDYYSMIDYLKCSKKEAEQSMLKWSAFTTVFTLIAIKFCTLDALLLTGAAGIAALSTGVRVVINLNSRKELDREIETVIKNKDFIMDNIVLASGHQVVDEKESFCLENPLDKLTNDTVTTVQKNTSNQKAKTVETRMNDITK